MRKRIVRGLACATVVTATLLAVPAFGYEPITYGGWSEDSGAYVLFEDGQDGISLSGRSLGQPHHGGEMQKSTNSEGTTIKRAHGWTTWTNAYHYTTARMEDTCLVHKGTVFSSSGRVWGWNGTEAYSPWVAATRMNECMPGSARTYYGR